MVTERGTTRGRPPAASRELLQDAAYELFLEQGYAGTTVEHITRRAGVSRNTFFNYFGAKGDVFWVELDEALEHLAQDLDSLSPSSDPLRGLGSVIVDLGTRFGPLSVPFVLTQHELIGSAHELQASAVTRFTTAAHGIRSFLVARGIDSARAQAAAYAVVGSSIAAATTWAGSGAARGTLGPFLGAAVIPVLEGYARAS